jgi:hypothetical protein
MYHIQIKQKSKAIEDIVKKRREEDQEVTRNHIKERILRRKMIKVR